MRFKETIRLTKEALKQPWLYTDEELIYMRKAKKMAKRSLKMKQLRGDHAKSDAGASNAKS